MALWCITDRVRIKRPCRCGCNVISLFNDSGTHYFYLVCPNNDDHHFLEDLGYRVDIDEGQSLATLLLGWNASEPPSEEDFDTDEDEDEDDT